MLFHLKDGGSIGGVYGGESYVSTFPHPKEIYLEKVCTVKREGQLIGLVPKTKGLLISMDACNFVELFEVSSIT
ncbi:DUF6338 family protein [Ktedonobacter racemifer]|uniref:Uncharacterized protein n=1 Tax=Ktedonobacter racemifer DSM 44963 TaxID=485913 RepID=D6TWJ6_KTERA|nr:conserved hypothetical protein [Ktedonobacter racemifer DSM 44963]